MTLGRAHAGLQAEAAQIRRHVFRRRAAMLGVSRIGRDRLDAQQRKQPVEA
jgi:hypothetical protein